MRLAAGHLFQDLDSDGIMARLATIPWYRTEALKSRDSSYCYLHSKYSLDDWASFTFQRDVEAKRPHDPEHFANPLFYGEWRDVGPAGMTVSPGRITDSNGRERNTTVTEFKILREFDDFVVMMTMPTQPRFEGKKRYFGISAFRLGELMEIDAEERLQELRYYWCTDFDPDYMFSTSDLEEVWQRFRAWPRVARERGWFKPFASCEMTNFSNFGFPWSSGSYWREE